MQETVTTLPIAPTTFGIIYVLACLIGLTAVIYWLLNRGKHPYSPPIWEDVPGGWHPVVILLGLLWVGLFGLTIAAAYAGVWQMIGASGAPASPGLGIGALLAALLGGPFLIWGTVLKHRTVGFQKEGHITDRINTAVEMLGAEKTVKKDGVEETVPNIEVRIGAILSLERIAQDSTAYDKGRDHVRVMEILCAYVRENAPAHNLLPTPEPFSRKRPRIDIQFSLSVLGRRSPQQIKIEKLERYRLDLRFSDLDGANLSKSNFSLVMFWQSRLESADLSFSDFTATQFYGALLNFANFYEANFYGTRLDRAILSRTRFFAFARTRLHGVSIEGADVSDLNFVGRETDDLFGSQDTIVGYHYQEAKAAGLRIARDRFLEESVEEGKNIKAIEKEVPEEQRHFVHWNPFTSSDGAAGIFRGPYRKRKNLIGWPFDD